MEYKIKVSQTFIPYLIALIILVGGIVYLDELSGSFTSEIETIKLKASDDVERVFIWQPEYIELTPKTSYTKNQLFKAGLESYENEDWNTAIDQWRTFLIQNPKAYQVWELLGRTYVKNRQYTEAINAFKQSLVLNRSYFPAMVHLGNSYFAIQQFYKAESLYQKAALQQPQSSLVHVNLGLVYGRQQNWKAALSEFIKSSSVEDKSLKAKSIYYEGLANLNLSDTASAFQRFKLSQSINPSYLPPQIQEALLTRSISSEGKNNTLFKLVDDKGKELESYVYYSLAKFHNHSGSKDDAETFYLHALQANPEDKELKLALGKHYLEQKKFEQAEMLFKQMVNLEPMMPRPYYYLAELESFKSNQKQAIALYEKAISTAENVFPEAHVGKGKSLEKLNDLEGAIQSYQQALSIRPEYPEAFFQLGEAYLKKKELQLAVESFKTSIELKPDFADSWYGLGKTFELLNDNSLALEAYENALIYDPQMFNARMAVATLHKEQNNYSEAISQFNFILNEHPNYLPAMVRLGEAYEKDNRQSEAIRVFEKIVKLRPDHFEAKERLAGLSAAKNNTKKAAKLYEELVKAIPFDHELRFKLAMQYEKQAKYKAAVRQLEKALELEPGYEKAYKLLEDIKSQSNEPSVVAYKVL